MSQSQHAPETAKRFRVNSIFVKLAGVIGLAAALLTAMVVVENTRATRAIVLSQLRHAAHEVNDLATASLSGAIRFGDPAPIEAQIAALTGGAQETVYGLAVNAGGELIIAGGPARELEPALLALARQAIKSGADAVSQDGMQIATAAVHGDAVVGAFATATTSEHSLAAAWQDQLRVIVIAAFTVAIGIIVLVVGLRLWIARPMTRLARAVDEVAHDNLDVMVPGIGRGDELGDIGKAVERFREALQSAAETRRESAFRGAAFRASQSAMMMVDRDMNIIYVNRSVTELLRRHQDALRQHMPDFDPDAIVGRNMDEFHPGELRTRVRRILEDPANLPYTAAIAVADARLSLKISPVEDERGHHIGYVNEWRDVSVEYFTRAAMQALDENMLKADFEIDGSFRYANDRFYQVFGRAPQDGGPWPAATEVSERMAAAIGRCARGEADYDEFVVAMPGMPRLVLDGGFTPVKDDKGRVIRITFLGKDVTAAKASLEAAEAERASMLSAQAQVVDGLRQGLGKLRDGDLTVRITEAFSADYEQLRQDFNLAVEHLLQAMNGVIENADQIRGEASEISNAADDLSSRTERQAATLEQTASALDELTSSVKSAADGAAHANGLVEGARQNAEDSGEVVREAVAAMGEIESSSNQISKIIDVIDDIAFQTNLLALNAGVEAARAGEAGRGFAVVASEVRALAQRSSDAAREINDLISASGGQVKRGVELVDRAGVALNKIVDSVKEISRHVSDIAVSSREQSSGLAEINAAMNQLDHVTQQNAAMFEETTAASHALTREAEALIHTTGRFRTDRAAVKTAEVVSADFADRRDAPRPIAAETAISPKAASAGGAAAAPVANDDGWDEF